MLHCFTLRYTVLHCVTLCYTVLHFVTLCTYASLCFTELLCITQCYAVLHCATLFYTVLVGLPTQLPQGLWGRKAKDWTLGPYTPTLHSYISTLLHSYTPTLLYSYNLTLLQLYTPKLQHSYTHTLIHSYTPTRWEMLKFTKCTIIWKINFFSMLFLGKMEGKKI